LDLGRNRSRLRRPLRWLVDHGLRRHPQGAQFLESIIFVGKKGGQWFLLADSLVNTAVNRSQPQQNRAVDPESWTML
jgi:hypothetical protein